MSPGHVIERLGPSSARTTVALVHGVGFGPDTLWAVAERLAGRHRVLVVTRPGYPSCTPRPWADPTDHLPSATSTTSTLEDDATMLAATLADEGPLTLAGVSGGATLGLALLLGRSSGRADVRTLIAHEPLVGPLAPTLHAGVSASAVSLAADHDSVAFLQRLVGARRWAALDPTWRHDATANADAVRGEVARFASFAPEADALAQLRGRRIVVTVGADSPPARHEAAAALADHAGAEVVVVPDAGHLVQADQPEWWSNLVDHLTAGVAS